MDKTRPNIILCLCDQMRSFEVGCYGNSVIRTPHIDKLATEGVRFDIACSNNPVCTPARSSLLTGQYSRTCNGTMNNTDIHPPAQERKQMPDATLPETLREAGYETALIGKWHIHPHPLVAGFDKALYPYFRHRNTGQSYFVDDGEGFIVDGFAPDYEANEVKRFLETPREKPFFLYYNISPPHMPLDDAPEKYKAMYNPKEIPLRPNVWKDGQLSYSERWFKIYLWDFLFYQEAMPYTERLPEGFDLKNLTALYYGLTTWVDDLVGRMMDTLKAQGLAENTIVVFTSDHGDNLGSHDMFNKGSLIEEAIRIPMIYRWPKGVSPQDNTTQVTSLIDVMPTLLSLAGVKIPTSVQGTDLLPVLKEESCSVGENAAFIETGASEIGIRTATHLYGMKVDLKSTPKASVTDERYMFYDLREDPYEFDNLAKNKEHDAQAELLPERLLMWNRNTAWKA